ncbi:Rv1476 family membrane protein [Nocardia sp. NBC_00416]|uniref:Rv1476 family membrane protein n=1 Tax=Nocardia sp. NBC_00416 TaxID=2975991 RepID=UPI002E1C094D
MTVTHTSAFSLKATKLPDGFDSKTMQKVRADLADNAVAAPDGADQEKLAAVVDAARHEGIELSVVVIEGNPGHDSELRDLATEIAKTEHDTVLVLSQDWVGTYSDSFSRVRLELAEDHVRAVQPAEAVDVKTRTFVDRVQHEGIIDPTTVTIVLLLGIVLGIAGLSWLKARAGTKTPLPEDDSHTPERVSV